MAADGVVFGIVSEYSEGEDNTTSDISPIEPWCIPEKGGEQGGGQAAVSVLVR